MSRDEHLFWFHGKISRERAEEILKEEKRDDGAFLVRESNTAIGDFVLSVLYKDDVCHYQIRRHGEDAFFSIDDKVKIMHGLESLVDYYRESSNGLVTKLTQMVKKDPPPNDSRSHGTTNLLHRATKEKNQTVVSELLKCGYRNVDAKNQDGQTAVHLAALYSTEEILKLLLNAGVNVNCMDSTGNTPLHYACRTKSASFVRALIGAKANIQVRNINSGYVPLHDAARHGNMDAVNELLIAHAPHMPRTNFGEFPIDLAKETNHTEVVEFLTTYQPPPATTYRHQWYHGTLERQEAVKVLLDYAANFVLDGENGNKNQGTNTLESASTSSVPPLESKNIESTPPIDKSGIYLIRFSSRHGYVLTMLCQNNPKNFLIKQSKNHLYIDEGPYLPSLEHLVQHFSLFSDGLPVNLKYPVPPKPKPPLPLFSTMPKSSSRKNIIQNSLCSPNVSHPGDDAMNRVGLFENDDCIMLETGTSPKKPKEKRDMLIFRSLKPAKRNVIIDGMKSLRKVKIRSPSKAEQEKAAELKKDNDRLVELQKAESLINNLSFSTDFLHQPPAAAAVPTTSDALYNVPKNNSVVSNKDLLEKDSQTLVTNDAVDLEKKTDEELEYFTKTDVLIARERGIEQTDYFVDAPPPINMKTFPLLNSQGYVPTTDIRKFMDMPSTEETTKLLEESAAELREFSNHPERLDSIMSTTSIDSEFKGLFNRQISTTSGMSVSTENNRAKLNYFIPNDCLELENIVGEGEFGSVYKGYLLRRNSNPDMEVRCPVAIKTLRDEHCRSNKQEFLREASVMIRLKHHCIVQLIGISKGKSLMMVQEMVPLGSMLHFIIENSTKINPNYELKIWASQIACGMNYLESQHFVHRDLAARNILLASRNQAKISDFGLSRAMGTDNACYQATQGGKWPIKWYAPESYNNGYFSHASDVWSFGVTLWEMFSLGDPPYGDIRGVDAIELIESGQRLQRPPKCPENVYKIMENCWNYKPKDRPTFRYLTDFFSNDPDYQNLVELIKTEHIS